jgi:hypothetical protein
METARERKSEAERAFSYAGSDDAERLYEEWRDACAACGETVTATYAEWRQEVLAVYDDPMRKAHSEAVGRFVENYGEGPMSSYGRHD